MDKILMLLLVLILIPKAIAQENLYLEYSKNITLLPNSNQTISLFIKNLGESRLRLNISCESTLLVECPSRVELDPEEVKVILIGVKTKELGIYPIYLKVGEEEAVIMVKVSNLPNVLFGIIEYYNTTLDRLIRSVEEIYIHEFENVKRGLKVAYGLCEYGLYEKCAEELNEVRKQIEAEIVKMLEGKFEKREERGITNFIFVPYHLIFPLIFFLVIPLYFLLISTRKKCERKELPTFYSDLSKVKRLIGKPPSLEEVGKGESNLSSIEREISLMEKHGKDVTELKLLLKLLKEKKKEGHSNLAKRYLKRLRAELNKLRAIEAS